MQHVRLALTLLTASHLVACGSDNEGGFRVEVWSEFGGFPELAEAEVRLGGFAISEDGETWTELLREPMAIGIQPGWNDLLCDVRVPVGTYRFARAELAPGYFMRFSDGTIATADYPPTLGYEPFAIHEGPDPEAAPQYDTSWVFSRPTQTLQPFEIRRDSTTELWLTFEARPNPQLVIAHVGTPLETSF